MSRTLPVAKGSMAEEAAASVTSPNLTTDPVAFGPGRARRSPAPSPNLEPGQPFRFLLESLDVVHFGAVRTLVSEAHHALDRVRLALEDRLDRALGGVAYPPAHSLGGGLAASCVAKEDPLHLAVHDHAPSDRLARHLSAAQGSPPTAMTRRPERPDRWRSPPTALRVTRKRQTGTTWIA